MSVTRVGIVLYPDAEELDWAGPFEVFTMAAVGREVEVVTIAEREGPVRCAKGLRVLPDSTFASAPPLDVVLVPGGKGSRVEMNNPAMLDWLVKAAEPCRFVTSVCTGAIVLCKAGLRAAVFSSIGPAGPSSRARRWPTPISRTSRSTANAAGSMV